MSSTKYVRLYPWRDDLDSCLQQLFAFLPPPQKTRTRIDKAYGPHQRRAIASIRNGQYTYENDHDASSFVPEETQSSTLSTETTPDDIRSPIESVDLCFDLTDTPPQGGNHHPIDLDHFHKLLDTISHLSLLTSFMVRVPPPPTTTTTTERDPPEILADLPLSALTSFLCNSSSLQYFTLIGIPLYDTSDHIVENHVLDHEINGFLEALRIHPSLQSVAIKDCFFASDRHWIKCQGILQERGWSTGNSFAQRNNIVLSPEQRRKKSTTDDEDHFPFSWQYVFCALGVTVASYFVIHLDKEHTSIYTTHIGYLPQFLASMLNGVLKQHRSITGIISFKQPPETIRLYLYLLTTQHPTPLLTKGPIRSTPLRLFGTVCTTPVPNNRKGVYYSTLELISTRSIRN